ncbi:MAG: hypothetical protein M1497_01675 [Nitrospirae bacterium]|nr:hypothetical protein [Nitrospirota bacterium]
MSEKKQEPTPTEKSQAKQDKPKPYPLRSVPLSEDPGNSVTIEYPAEENN